MRNADAQRCFRVDCGRLALVACLTMLLAAGGLAAQPKPGKAKLPPAVQITFQPSHAMLAPGSSVDLQIRAVDQAGKPVTDELTVRLVAPGRKFEGVNVALDSLGRGHYRFSAASGLEPGIQMIEFRHSKSGVVGNYYVDMLDPQTHAAFEKASQQIKLSRLPVHLLFLGDSLTDMYRGQNYVDKVGFWLGKIYGDRASVKNAGVGGDTIVRAWQRLNKEPSTYRVTMYDDLYTPLPTHVFYFFGHNDSKLTSASEYRTPVVDPNQFEELYRSTLRKVQAETKAKMVVLSASSSVYEITQATAAKARASGRTHNLFGKPEALEQFNAIARKVAVECRADYLDVYETTRRHTDKPSLFTKDGVHIGNLGNRLLALEVLKYLGVR